MRSNGSFKSYDQPGKRYKVHEGLFRSEDHNIVVGADDIKMTELDMQVILRMTSFVDNGTRLGSRTFTFRFPSHLNYSQPRNVDRTFVMIQPGERNLVMLQHEFAVI